mgnify:CR=1 FL=1
MSYRCEACSIVVPPGSARKVHTLYYRYKTLSQIAREVPICAACKHLLDKGKTLADLQSRGAVPAPVKGLDWLNEEEQAHAND